MSTAKNTLKIMLLLPLLFSMAQAGVVRDYPADKVSAHVYVIHGPLGEPSVENQGFMNNPAFVVRPEGVVVIDPGSSLQAGEMVIRQIQKVTQAPVTHVLNTHVHGDHWLGNQAFRNQWPKVKMYGHPEMIKKSKAGEDIFWIGLMERATNGFTSGTVAVIPESEATDSMQLSLNGLSYKIYAPEKAHSGTDIMIEIVEDSIIFLGDNVTYKRIARMDDGSFKGNINACEVALNTGSKLYVPGHGPTAGTEVVESFQKYLQTVYTEVQKLYEEGLQDYEMKPTLEETLVAYHDWNGFEDAIGKHISLAILEIEADF